MAFIDHHDVVVGSTDDGHTFIVLNRPIRTAHRALTASGFTAREHNRRTVYLLPPGTSAEEAHNRTGDALHALLAHTMDFVDLSWTTRYPAAGPVPEAAVRFDLSDGQVTATVHAPTARDVIAQHGFAPTPQGHVLAAQLSEREAVGAVARAEAHLSSLGLPSKITLGIPTPKAIPAAPGHTGATTPARPSPVPRQSRRPR
ncbi:MULTISPECIES: hypothetical protein [Streptomyces]|uniref:hypothetical protein n=1 Tax=Streptomyces TaxID=1883 RepID=UPI00163D19E5|nr:MULTISPECIES: hypothetical protein [Streptomyces]MBC2878051.1 hypothetical protein [Streptomyces sp. TYQ1024]UBI40002.1 hypothetical protein K7I03_28420 [Streptomyces mobaraensis]UKW32583.1 hypothetical protein MCU78_28350 [Streptomyces sp. TYQ1024]